VGYVNDTEFFDDVNGAAAPRHGQAAASHGGAGDDVSERLKAMVVDSKM
jgi:hypothetical protein